LDDHLPLAEPKVPRWKASALDRVYCFPARIPLSADGPTRTRLVEDVRQVFADFTPSELRQLERLMKKAGRQAEALQRKAAPGNAKP
jgi:hypothetical protein